MSKKTQQLFQAIDVAYNDPEMVKHPEIRQQLLEAAKDLQSPAALSQLYTTIGATGDRYFGEATFFGQLFK